MKRKGFFRTILLCAALLAAAFGFPVKTQAEEKRTVRVGYVPSEEFLEQYEEGGKTYYSGYMSEFLEVLSYYGDWEYEFVSGTWDECKKRIADGTIDLLPGAMAEDAGENVALSALPFDTVWDNIYVPFDTEVKYGSYETLQNAKIGYIRGGYTNEAFFSEHGLNCELEPYDTVGAAETALRNQQINAVMCIGEVQNAALVARVSPRCTYMAYSVRNPELQNALEEAYGQLMMEMPDLVSSLQDKYTQDKKQENVLLFSQIEQEWIKAHTNIAIAYVADKRPNEYLDENGKPAGIHIDYIEKVLETVGMEANWIAVSDLEQAYSYLDRGLVDAVSSASHYSTSVQSGKMMLTDSYREAYYTILGKKGAKLNNPSKPLSVAVRKGDELSIAFLRQSYPECKIVTKTTEEEVFRAIRNGEAKATVVLANREEYYQLKYDMSLVSLTNQYEGIPVSLAVKRSGSGQFLISIFNQGIQSLNADTINAIALNHNEIGEDYTFFMWIKKYRIRIVTSVLAVLLAGGMGLYIYRRRQRAALWKANYIDKVTGLGNYEKMMIDIKPLFESKNQSDQNQNKYGIVALDMVKFKNLNETYGYSTGNQVLEVMAKSIANECGEDEYCARAGGDQFVMVWKSRNTEELTKRAEQLAEWISREIQKLNSEYKARITAGVYFIQDDKDPYFAIDKANMARKSVRDSRSRNVAVYDIHMHRRALQEREIETIMYQSLADGEFQLYLQPRVVIGTGEIVAAEALVRWQRKSGEMIYPDTFIPVFEANGFIREMDFYIYEKVCQMLKERLENQQPVVPISVNVSRAHLVGGDFLSHLNALVRKYEIPEDYLELELTESLLVDDPTRMIDTVNQLKENHYKVSIDDFGSGYSSLNILKQLRFDVLKIDKEFLRIEGVKPEDKIILENVIHMAKELQMQVLVEGVEVKEQQTMLTQMGCDFAQGYYFSRPIPMVDFLALLEKQRKAVK